MIRDFVLAGVGGQGVISLGALLAAAGRSDGLQVQVAEVHGMAQRGGAVQASLRLADEPIHGALIPEGTARGILSTEPLEGLRYLHYLAHDGVLVTATEPEVNIPDYPPVDELHARPGGGMVWSAGHYARLAMEPPLDQVSVVRVRGDDPLAYLLGLLAGERAVHGAED